MDQLVSLLIVLVIASIVYWIITQLPIVAPLRTIILVIFGVIVLLWVLNVVGFIGGNWHLHPRR